MAYVSTLKTKTRKLLDTVSKRKSYNKLKRGVNWGIFGTSNLIESFLYTKPPTDRSRDVFDIKVSRVFRQYRYTIKQNLESGTSMVLVYLWFPHSIQDVALL